MTQYRIESIENLGIKACLSHYSRKTGLSGRIRNNKGINACGNNQCPSGCRLNLNYLTRCNCRLRCIKNPTNLNWITAFCSTGCCCSSDSHRSGNTGISQTTPCRVSLLYTYGATAEAPPTPVGVAAKQMLPVLLIRNGAALINEVAAAPPVNARTTALPDIAS